MYLTSTLLRHGFGGVLRFIQPKQHDLGGDTPRRLPRELARTGQVPLLSGEQWLQHAHGVDFVSFDVKYGDKREMACRNLRDIEVPRRVVAEAMVELMESYLRRRRGPDNAAGRRTSFAGGRTVGGGSDGCAATRKDPSGKREHHTRAVTSRRGPSRKSLLRL